MRFMKQILRLPLNSLSLRVLLAYIVGVALSILCIGLIVTALIFTQESRLLLATDLADVTGGISRVLVFDNNGVPIGLDCDDVDEVWFFDSLNEEAAYRVLDVSGNTVLSSSAGEMFWPMSIGLYIPESGHFEFEYQGLAIQGATVAMEREGKVWFVQVAVSTRFLNLIDEHIAVPFMVKGVALFGLVLLFVFGFCAYITLKHTLKPLREVSASAATISPHSLHARLDIKKVPSEIASLVDSFNRVLDRLEQGFRVQQDFLATAAHELKTPLALIRAQIELKEKNDDRDALLNDVAHMARQVQQLLLLAEVSESHNYNPTMVDVAVIASEVVSYLRPMADTSNVRVIVTCIAEVRWYADRAALFTLLKNLLENAIQHAPRETEISVEINASIMTVRDWGPGVQEEQLSQLFVRFWRGAHRRDYGAGLGLAICWEIARSHGWMLSAHHANPGLCFLLVCQDTSLPQ